VVPGHHAPPTATAASITLTPSSFATSTAIDHLDVWVGHRRPAIPVGSSSIRPLRPPPVPRPRGKLTADRLPDADAITKWSQIEWRRKQLLRRHLLRSQAVDVARILILIDSGLSSCTCCFEILHAHQLI